MKFIVTISLFLIAQLTFSQDKAQKIDSLLNAYYTKGKINGNFLVAEKGKVIYSKSFGYADKETKEKLDENTIFELASCSKQFTAMGIMILKERGKLNLEDELGKYIPELSFYKGVIIKNLLNHTSGLPDYMELLDSLFDKTKIATNKDIIDLFAKEQPKVSFEPNSKFEYSNTGFALLASIIENVSGLSFGDFLAESIFKPLQMNRTFVYTRRYAPKKIDNYAYGYVYSDSLNKFVLPDELPETEIVIWLDGIVGDGCVNSTVNDLLKWDRALYTDKLISKKGIKAVFMAQTLNDKSKSNYGYGWGLDKNKTFGEIASHSGGWPGYVTFIDRHIGEDRTIIALQNHDNVVLPIKAIRYILINEEMPAKKVQTEITLKKEQLEKFVGIYKGEQDFEFKVFLEDEKLLVQLTGQSAIQLHPESELSFFIKEVDAQIQFKKNANDEIEKLVLLQNGQKLEAIRAK
jgi:CubicO group peptidase (beta-lactamase class C family)